MSSISVDSEFYSLYIDTGITVSIAHDPFDPFGGSNTYFKDMDASLLEDATTYMPIIDLWVKDEINLYNMPIKPINEFGAEGVKVNLSYTCSSTSITENQIITLALKTPISEQTQTDMQQRLCQFKASLEPVIVVKTLQTEEQLLFGLFQTYPTNIREDLLDKHEETNRNNAIQFKNVLAKAINTVEKKFNTTLHNEKPEQNDGYYVKERYASWREIKFTTWVVEEDLLYAEEISWALTNYINREKYDEKLIAELPAMTKEYFETNIDSTPIPSTERKLMLRSIIEILTLLQESYKAYDINVSFRYGKNVTYPYEINALTIMYEHIPFFKQLISEVKDNTTKMKKNNVSAIELSTMISSLPPRDKARLLCLGVTSKPYDKEVVYSTEFTKAELAEKETRLEFYQFLHGEQALRFSK